MSTSLYLRPDLDQGDREPVFVVSGVLKPAKVAKAYSSDLKASGHVGPLEAVQVGGDTLPGGHTISTSGDLITISWPEYAENNSVINNSSFDNLLTGWDPGPGWIAASGHISPPFCAAFSGVSGTSPLSSKSRYPVGTAVINCSCRVEQGASSAGNAGAGVCLEYRDSDGEVVARHTGEMIMSGSNGAVKTSSLVSDPSTVSGAVTVNIGCIGTRKKENHEVFVDDFKWDHKSPSVGVNHERTYNITIKVTDSAGRVAFWSGSVSVWFKLRSMIGVYGYSSPLNRGIYERILGEWVLKSEIPVNSSIEGLIQQLGPNAFIPLFPSKAIVIPGPKPVYYDSVLIPFAFDVGIIRHIDGLSFAFPTIGNQYQLSTDGGLTWGSPVTGLYMYDIARLDTGRWVYPWFYGPSQEARWSDEEIPENWESAVLGADASPTNSQATLGCTGKHAFYLSDNGILVRSSEDGTSWAAVNNLGSSDTIHAIAGFKSGDLLIVLNSGKVYHSPDHGVTINYRGTLPTTSSYFKGGSISEDGNGEVMICIRRYQGDLVAGYVSSNMFETWEAIPAPPNPGGTGSNAFATAAYVSDLDD